MTETIRYGLIGKQDIRFGTGKFEVTLADGRVVTLDEFNLVTLLVDSGLVVPSYSKAGLPAAGTAGRLARMTDGGTPDNIVEDNGSNWRSIYSRTTGVIVITDPQFGADPAATASANQTAIQAAIDAAAGSTVLVPEGTFNLAGGLTVPSNTRLVGVGRDSVLRFADTVGANIAMIRNADQANGNSNISILDLRLDGNRAGQSFSGDNGQNGIELHGVNNFLIQNVIASSFGKDSFYFGIAGTKISSDGRVIGNFASDNRRIGFTVVAGEDIIFAGNTAVDMAGGVSGNGFHVESNNAANATRRLTYVGNVATGNAQAGFVLANGKQADVSGLIWAGNVASGNTQDGFFIQQGNNNQAITLQGNTIVSNSRDGIRVAGSGRYVRILGNTISNNTAIGINSTVNAIERFQIQQNYVGRNGQHGIVLLRGSGHRSHHLITGNVIDANGTSASNTYDGINVSSDSAASEFRHTIINNNQIIDLEASPTQRYGLNFGANTASNIVEGNRFQGNVSGQINNSAGASFIRANSGFVTENSGTGTINSGATSATVSHGLDVTPTAKAIVVNFTENPTNDPGNFWISAITSTQFTVNVRNDPGASNLDFTWQVTVY
ncbi:MAG: right-handed parallel beta-helix repeat-containing protein [Betaproteobacteria bacterium]|nr:right-handed parallel beta-helix repeat-containing protein [Betaproteobacteria bacterium]